LQARKTFAQLRATSHLGYTASMLGTLINVGAILAGGSVGLFLHRALPQRFQRIVLQGLGLITLLLGLQMALKTANIFIVLGSLLLGALLGEWWRLQDRLDALGRWLEAKFKRSDDDRFTEGFVTTSLLFCIGPMAILGSIQDGVSGDYKTLAIKALMDGFAAIVFAAELGWGVLFSAATVLVYQGSLTLLAAPLQRVLTGPMINEMSAVGGLMIVGISLMLLEIKRLPLANFLPALALAPLLAKLF
jgi:uncharacterized membrane protein YqgA involved in biofilm formation